MNSAGVHNEAGLETAAGRIGRELLARALALAPSAVRPAWWHDHAMKWSMDSKRFADPLFGLVDVLPALADPQAVLRHVREYIGTQAAHGDGRPWRHWDALVAWLLGTQRTMRSRQWASATLRGAAWAARRFIAGSDADSAAKTLLELRRKRLAFSLDLLGEKVLSEREADAYAQAYMHLIDSLTVRAATWPADSLLDTSAGRPIPRVNFSIKLTGLYSQFDPVAPGRSVDEVLRRLTPIMRLARRRGAFVNIDMEQYEVKDLTLACSRGWRKATTSPTGATSASCSRRTCGIRRPTSTAC